MLLDRRGLVTGVVCAYCKLGHLVGGGRLETRATNSKLRQEKEEDEMRGRMNDDFFTNVSDYTMYLFTAS